MAPSSIPTPPIFFSDTPLEPLVAVEMPDGMLPEQFIEILKASGEEPSESLTVEARKS